MTKNFHRNSDVDRLYLQRKNGGRSLTSIKIASKIRVTTAIQHIRINQNNNKYFENVKKHKSDNPNHSPRNIKRYSLKEASKTRKMYGYKQKIVAENGEINGKATKTWLTRKYISSHFEAYTYTRTRNWYQRHYPQKTKPE